MKKIHSTRDYDFYVGVTKEGSMMYNIVPRGQPAPTGGYSNPGYIEKVKKTSFPNLTQEEINNLKRNSL